MRKKLISLTLLLCMALALCVVFMPLREARADHTPISTVVASSNISSILVDGGLIQSPTFTTTQGAPAYVNGGSGFGYWSKKEGDTWVSKTGSFSPGTWRFSAQLRIDSSAYVLSNPSLTVDGSAWVVNLPTLTVYDNLCYVSIQSKEYTVPGSITSVAITITKPAPGDLPDYAPALPGAGGRYALRNVNDTYWKNGVKWFDYTDGTLYSPLTPDVSCFEGDRVYRVAVNLTPASGYTFTSSTSATVNGYTATAELGSNGILVVKYVFPRTPKETITSADVTVTEPREDYQPNFEAETSSTLYTVDAVKWYDLHRDKYMGNFGDYFYGHGEFRAEIRLAPASGYAFTGSTTGRINGMNAAATLQDDGKLLLQYTFTCPYPISDPQVYIDQPLPGKAPDYTPRFYSKAYGQGSNGFGQYQNGVAWQDVTTGYYMEVGTDVFEGGHDYRVYIYVKPSSTYIFPSYVKGRINDKDADTVLQNDGEVLLKYVFHCNIAVPPVSITVKAPAVGAHPDYDPVFPADAHCYASYSEGDWKNGVCWVDLTRKAEDGYGFMDPDSSVFEAGHQYKVRIDIWADTGYVITDGFSCTINGTAAIDEGYDEYARTFPTLAAGGWKKDSKGWWYQRADGTYPKNQWEKINGKWYHFDANGYMQTGWLKLDGKWYYFNPGDDGSMVTGWKKLSGKWYYFNTGNDGSMVTGWQTLNGKRYYFSSDGAMLTGWQKLSGKWYYFKPGDDGSMVTGWQTLGGKKYYFNSDGSMATGWQKLSGKWYYFATGDSGHMLTGWQKLNNKWYYFNTDGSMATGWQRINSKWYYFLPGDNGQMVTGWKQIDGDWYYFMPGNDGSMVANTTMTIDGKSYTFASNGVCTNP